MFPKFFTACLVFGFAGLCAQEADRDEDSVKPFKVSFGQVNKKPLIWIEMEVKTFQFRQDFDRELNSITRFVLGLSRPLSFSMRQESLE